MIRSKIILGERAVWMGFNNHFAHVFLMGG
jgi:hypothetical protein